MNENIKFRAWDEKEKRMLYPDPLSSSWGTKDSQGNISDIPAVMTWNGGVYLHKGEGKYELQTHIILLQYCRCKDKNGKEIYQGDIIKEKYSEPGGGYDEVFRIVNNVVISNNITIFDAEIVGNIYEHPQLALELAGKIK